MITHERLEELIEQEKGCYILANAYTIGYIHLDGKYEPKIEETEDNNYNLWVFTSNDFAFRDCVHDYSLFETKEEAEWHLKFGNIARTETLSLPSWEEFLKDNGFDFLDKKGFHWDVYYDGENILMANGYGHYSYTYNKEGYEKACELAKKLFLGEEI